MGLHALLEEQVLSPSLDLCDSFHGPERGLHGLSVVSNRSISSLLELERRVDSQFFASILPESLCPLDLSWITFSYEVSMAFRSAECEDFRVVSDECHTVTGIHRTTAKVTSSYSHFSI